MSYSEEELTRKRQLLEKLGLKESQNFGEPREKVWRPNKHKKSYWDTVIRRSYHPDERAIRHADSLAKQRNRARRK